MSRLLALLAAIWLAFVPAARASQATLVTPSAPLPMSSLAAFLNGALLSVGSCNSGTSAPANGSGAAAFQGECWMNTSASPYSFNLTDDGTHWSPFGSIDTSTHVFMELDGSFAVAAKGVNFNSANSDTVIALSPPTARYLVVAVYITNASASISTATGGVFTATGGGGQAVAANQALTITQTGANTNNNAMALNISNGNTEAYNVSTLYFRVGTAEGSAATADVTIYLRAIE